MVPFIRSRLDIRESNLTTTERVAPSGAGEGGGGVRGWCCGDDGRSDRRQLRQSREKYGKEKRVTQESSFSIWPAPRTLRSGTNTNT